MVGRGKGCGAAKELCRAPGLWTSFLNDQMKEPGHLSDDREKHALCSLVRDFFPLPRFLSLSLLHVLFSLQYTSAS